MRQTFEELKYIYTRKVLKYMHMYTAYEIINKNMMRIIDRLKSKARLSASRRCYYEIQLEFFYAWYEDTIAGSVYLKDQY